MLIRYVKPDFVFENENGCLKQLVHNGWKQFNVIKSYAESVRGGHYHKFNEEGFYIISGSFKLTVWTDKVKENYEMKSDDMFIIPHNVYHTFEYHEDTLLISMYSNGVELNENEKDIWR